MLRTPQATVKELYPGLCIPYLIPSLTQTRGCIASATAQPQRPMLKTLPMPVCPLGSCASLEPLMAGTMGLWPLGSPSAFPAQLSGQKSERLNPCFPPSRGAVNKEKPRKRNKHCQQPGADFPNGGAFGVGAPCRGAPSTGVHSANVPNSDTPSLDAPRKCS